eukprot:9042081-Ditylum_brightwellii.AAC.1
MKLHLCLRRVYHYDLPGHLQSFGQQKLQWLYLLMIYLSPWQKAYFSGHDPSMITITGFHNQSFAWLLEMFEDVFYAHTTVGRFDYSIRKFDKTCGWQCLLSAKDCLGLVIIWTRTHGAM